MNNITEQLKLWKEVNMPPQRIPEIELPNFIGKKVYSDRVGCNCILVNYDGTTAYMKRKGDDTVYATLPHNIEYPRSGKMLEVTPVPK